MMVDAEPAGAVQRSGVVPEADEPLSSPVEPVVDAVEQVGLALLDEAANRIRGQVRYLDHGGEAGVHEQGRLYIRGMSDQSVP